MIDKTLFLRLCKIPRFKTNKDWKKLLRWLNKLLQSILRRKTSYLAKIFLNKNILLRMNRSFVWWRHFITMSRILQGFAFLCKLGLLLFKPHWGYQIYISKNSGCSSKMTRSCKWPIACAIRRVDDNSCVTPSLSR